jgi:hypothetical protein
MAQEPFLSALGVTAIQQARTPTATSFPLSFNPNNQSLWYEAVHRLEPSGDAQTDWALTIREYIKLCQDRGVFPFQNVHLQQRNDQISDFMRERRRAFVDFIDSAKFFDGVKVRTTKREVTVTDTGFVLTVTATAYIKDPSFEQWLQQSPIPNFTLIADRRHSRVLHPGLRMFAENEGSNSSWNIGYEIVCPIYPDLPDHHTPSKAEIENFVLSVLWMPLLRSIRPHQLTHRLI